MLKLKKIAITGDIASGKSAALRFMEDAGAFVVKADDIVHRLLSAKTKLGKQVIELLGSDIVSGSQICRKKIANKVFKEPEKLKKLEKLLHPVVIKEIEELYCKVQKESIYLLFVVEIPLIFEVGKEAFYDCIITVVSKTSLCIERLRQKGMTKQDYEERKKNMLPIEEKTQKSDFILTNNGSLQDLEKQVKELYEKLT